jgi:multiple sugar transport system ATP-binding protein
MKGGVLQQLGTPDDIYNRPANTYVATFIGSPTMNLIDVTGRGASGVSLAGVDLPLASPVGEGVVATLGLRPEHLLIRDDAAWRGEVSVVEPTGADTFVVVRTAAGDVSVRLPPQERLRPGDRVGLAVQSGHSVWFAKDSGLRIA